MPEIEIYIRQYLTKLYKKQGEEACLDPEVAQYVSGQIIALRSVLHKMDHPQILKEINATNKDVPLWGIADTPF